MSSAAWDLVIFDNDGVLVDSERIANEVLADLLTELGHPTTFADSIERYLGGSIGGVRELVETSSCERLPPDFERRYEDAVLARFDRDLDAVDGVADAIDAIEAPVCVASSGTPARIVRSLTLTGLLDRFAGRIFSASDVVDAKPAPDLFLHAAAVMGAEPGRVAVVEDSPLGVAAGRTAGMTVFAYAALTPVARLAGATVCFDAMGDLPVLLDRLASTRPGAARMQP